MDLSIVVPARNAAGTVGELLGALLPQVGPSAEVIVVDDASRDGTAEVVRRLARSRAAATSVRVLAGDGAGPSRARNQGAAAAAASRLAFCDADDVVGPGWVAAMGAALADHPYVTGPREVERLNPTAVVAVKGRGDWQVPRLFGVLPFAPSSNLGIHRDLLGDAGGFDEQLRVGEDLDLALRLAQRGVDLHFAPAAVVHYRYRQRPRELWRQGRAYGRAVVEIARRMRAAGIEGVPRFEDPGKWLWLAYRCWQVASPRHRARWLWQAGLRAGYVEGSLRSRTVLL